MVARGHAVEVRLYAEDAEDGFLPATGRVEALRWPAGEGVRVDAGIEIGDEIGGRFDPMLAKIIAWGPDRPRRSTGSHEALDETVVLGLVTNLRFLRWLVRQPVVLDGPGSDGHPRPHLAAGRLAGRLELAGLIPDEACVDGGGRGWRVIDVADRHGAPDPWAGGWRLNAAPSIRVESDGVDRTVAVATRRHRPAHPSAPRPTRSRRRHRPHRRRGTKRRVPSGAAARRRHRGARSRTSPRRGLGRRPGRRPLADAGRGLDGPRRRAARPVEAGDPIVTLEAMKMEHVVAAPIAGRVTELAVRAGGPGDARPAARGHRTVSVRRPPERPLRVRSSRDRSEDSMAHHETAAVPLPQTREELLDLHRETRRRRNAAPHGSEEHVEAIDLIGRIEVEIARIERAMDPPLV